MQVSTLDHPALALLPATPTQAQIEAFGQRLLTVAPFEAGGVELNVPIVHQVNSDLYGRGALIPAESFYVGLAHTQPGFAVSVGDITVWTEDGMQRYTGAHILKTQPGRMRIGFAHSETTWFTVHANRTGGIDVETIEDSLADHPERLQTRRNLYKVAP